MLDKIKSNLVTVSDKLTSFVFTEVDCPVYIINRSAEPNDYVLAFDFTDVIKTMRDSKLPKPQITVWAGRNDYDKEILSTNIKNAFVEQFEKAKLDLRQKDKKEQEVEKSNRDNGISFSISALVAMLLIANPIVDLLLLMFALSAGKDATLAQLNLIKKEFKKLTGNDVKTDVLDQGQENNIIDAIKALEIKIQKDLYLHAYSFGNEAGSLSGVDYKKQLPSFIKL